MNNLELIDMALNQANNIGLDSGNLPDIYLGWNQYLDLCQDAGVTPMTPEEWDALDEI